MLNAGEFYVGKYPPGSDKDRRFILVTDEDADECTLVWVYTSTQMSDQTVILPQGCHAMITQDCCVVYDQARISHVADIHAALEGGALVKHQSLDNAQLEQIQEGIFVSDETPDEVLDYCKDRI